MGKINTVLILVIVAAVNLSNGYSLTKIPNTPVSFSGSSSSSSAFAHSSSSSYTFNGPIDPNDLEKFKAGAAAGAAAGATAAAGALASAGAIAHAGAGALAGSVSGAFAGSSSIGGESSGHLSGADAGTGAASGVISKSETGCAGGSSGCGGSQDSNLIGGSTAPADTYKIINTNKYNTGYNSDSQGTNYAIAGQYVQGTQTGGGCSTCKGPFPGPNGSIHDYKLASSVPPKGNPSAGAAQAAANAGFAQQLQPPKATSNLPVAAGNIYINKPATNILPPAPSNVYYGTGTSNHAIESGHISPSLIATFPGPSESIYDSKPAGAGVGAGAGTGAGIGHSTGVVPVLPGPSGSIYDSKPAHGIGAGVGTGAGAGASAGAVSHSGSGSVSNIPSTHPVVGPACSYTSESSDKNCGGTTSSTSSGQTITGVIPILPGSSGSIYASKPANSVPTHGAASGAVAGAGAGSYSDSGSVTNIPSTHHVAGPACSYTLGSPNYCGGSAFSTELVI